MRIMNQKQKEKKLQSQLNRLSRITFMSELEGVKLQIVTV